jgi:hypothetical protein
MNFNTPVIPTAGYNTLIVTITGAQSGASQVCKLWINSGYMGRYFPFVTDPALSTTMVSQQWQIPVTGPNAQLSAIGGTSVGSYVVTVYGLTAALPFAYTDYFMVGGASPAWTASPFPGYPIESSLFTCSGNAVQDYSTPLTHVSGSTLLNCYCGVAGVFAIKPWNPFLANIWAATYTATSQLSVQVSLPAMALGLYFRPAAVGAFTATVSVTTIYT